MRHGAHNVSISPRIIPSPTSPVRAVVGIGPFGPLRHSQSYASMVAGWRYRMTQETIPIPVLIVDDHPVVRHGLRAILQTDPTLEVVGEAEDGLDALEQVGSLQPRVVLMDVHM